MSNYQLVNSGQCVLAHAALLSTHTCQHFGISTRLIFLKKSVQIKLHNTAGGC